MTNWEACTKRLDEKIKFCNTQKPSHVSRLDVREGTKKRLQPASWRANNESETRLKIPLVKSSAPHIFKHGYLAKRQKPAADNFMTVPREPRHHVGMFQSASLDTVLSQEAYQFNTRFPIQNANYDFWWTQKNAISGAYNHFSANVFRLHTF